MLDTDSELVEYEKDNTLNHPTDSVYSVMPSECWTTGRRWQLGCRP